MGSVLSTAIPVLFTFAEVVLFPPALLLKLLGLILDHLVSYVVVALCELFRFGLYIHDRRKVAKVKKVKKALVKQMRKQNKRSVLQAPAAATADHNSPGLHIDIDTDDEAPQWFDTYSLHRGITSLTSSISRISSPSRHPQSTTPSSWSSYTVRSSSSVGTPASERSSYFAGASALKIV